MSKTQLTATIFFFTFDGSRCCNEVRSLLISEHCASSRRSMEEVFHVSVWGAISPMLGADDVERLRVAAKGWNEGRRYGKMGEIFFLLLHSDPFAKHWNYDDEGCKLCTLRYPIMESFR